VFLPCLLLGEKGGNEAFKKTGGVPDLPELGLRGLSLKNLETAITRPHGIIIICGPTGSGKTTTLYSIISRINTAKVNIVTLEDPIEYKIPGVNQVQVNPAAGLTFASGLRSFLRQDPNIILVGEIRDRETADLAVQAALTGHLVFLLSIRTMPPALFLVFWIWARNLTFSFFNDGSFSSKGSQKNS